jgi:RNAse (barnase) inhibitor barstar
MADIFLSYSSKDRDRAAALAQALIQSGLTVFWDRKIPAGQNYHEYLESQLRLARLVVVIWTPASVASDWVKLEADEGIERDALLPVLMQDVQVPLRFKHVQMADLRSWRGSAEERSFKDLIEAITRKAGRRGYDTATPGPTVNKPPVTEVHALASRVRFQMRRLAMIMALIVVCWLWHVYGRYHNPWVYAQRAYYFAPTLHWLYLVVTSLFLPVVAAALSNNYRLTLLVPPLANLPPDLMHALLEHQGQVSLPQLFLFALCTMALAVPAALLAAIRHKRSGYVVRLTG